MHEACCVVVPRASGVTLRVDSGSTVGHHQPRSGRDPARGRGTMEDLQRRQTGGGVARRGILAGVAAVVAGVLAKWTAQPAAAGTDGDLVLNTTNTGTATTTLQTTTGAGFSLFSLNNQRAQSDA